MKKENKEMNVVIVGGGKSTTPEEYNNKVNKYISAIKTAMINTNEEIKVLAWGASRLTAMDSALRTVSQLNGKDNPLTAKLRTVIRPKLGKDGKQMGNQTVRVSEIEILIKR
jgi:hypothetical protein